MKAPSLGGQGMTLLRVGLGALFLYAGFTKLDAARIVTVDIVRLQIVPFLWAEWVAAILSMAELLTGAWLLSVWRPRAAALAVMTLTTTFALAVGQAMVRGLDFDCHCFGITAEAPPAAYVFIRALLLLALAGLLRRRCDARGQIASSDPLPPSEGRSGSVK